MVDHGRVKKPGLKQANTSMSVPPLGACPAKGINRSGPKSIALVSSYKRRYPEIFKTIG